MDLSKFHPTRRGFIRSVLLASGFAPALLSLVARAGAAEAAQLPIKAGVQELVGDVRLNGRPAKVGQVVRPGDVCMTGAESSCVIVLGEHVYLLREMSEVEFYPELFEEAAEAASALSGSIKMAAGAMLAVFGKTDTSIVTPMATIGIRGTACYTSIEPERTYACVCYGTADLASAVSGQALETVFSRHHDMPRYIYGPDAPIAIEKAKVIDHSDAELRMLEALVNRIPPFDEPGAPPYTRYDPAFKP
ncbi:hypothetical protein [Magnetovibrio blakemorei]|uniref:FecR protein domain-containing protein n=1 Tax=Magnetovibrio blakemorei TaxID=28181 RepID=A0A1E5Q4G0_9PROT|nr:hypothetical protein [Magnetovibrio blakemorei]OEJ65107.1 hypothetical protein BEN30_15605 [Magnetovibrio blakemorei]